MFETEPNGSFETATPVQIGQDIWGSLPSVDEPPYVSDADVFAFDATAGTTLWIDPVITDWGGPSCNKAVLCEPVDLWCSKQFGEAPVRVAHGFQIGPDPGENPVFFYTVPVSGRYYLTPGGGSNCHSTYLLRLRSYSFASDEAAQDSRDIVLVRSDDGGQTWSEKLRVNDDPPGLDTSFPAVTVDGLGKVWVAWYDRREDPTCQVNVQTHLASSPNGGLSFESSVKRSVAPSAWGSFASGENIGDHLGLTAEGDHVYLLWTQMGQTDVDIYATVIEDDATGIALGAFEAEALARAVRLRWFVADGEGVTAFRILRAQGESEVLESVIEVPALADGWQEVEDRTAEPGQLYRYWLEVVFAGGQPQRHGPIEIELGIEPSTLRWRVPSPNPFRTQVALALEVPEPLSGHVGVYDLRGREVTRLHTGSFEPGLARFNWDGRDHDGLDTPAGLYVVRAQLGPHVQAVRVLRIP